MTTRPIGEVTIAQTDYQRGDLFKEIDHDSVANAIRYLSFAKLYYPDKYHEFVKMVALHHATWSMEDSNFIDALYDFERGFTEFLKSHPTIEQEVNRLSPKQMVDRVDTEEIANVKERRDAARKMARRVVESATRRGAQVAREKEIEEVMRSAAIEAETPAQLQQFIKERIPIAVPVVDQIMQEDPRIMQQLLLSDPESTRGVLDQTIFSPLPNKRALHAIITNLPMDPNETRDQFLRRAASVTQTTVVLTSDLSQTPLPHLAPSGFIEAILSVQKDRRAIDALAAFNKLTEQAKNAVSLTVVAKAWEDTVDVITKRAGGALAPALEKVIQQGNAQLGSSARQSLGRAGEPINEIVGLLLRPTMGAYTDALLLNQSLPPGQKLFSDKNSVATFIQSLDATRRAEGAASAALFLTVTTHYPGVQFVEQHSDNPLAPVVTVVQFAKDSIVWKVFDRAAKSEVVGGFFGKILQPILGFFGIRVGAQAVAGKAAGAAAGKGIGAILGSLLGGTFAPVVGHIIGFVGGFFVMPLIQKVGGWIKNFVTGRVGKLKIVQDAIIRALNPQTAGAGAQEEQKKTDFMIMLVVGVPIIILVGASMLQIAAQGSAIVTSFESDELSGRGEGIEGKDIITYTGPAPPVSVLNGCPVGPGGRITQCPNVSLGSPNKPNSHFSGYGWSNAYDIGLPSGSQVSSTHGGYLVEYVSGVQEGGGEGYGNYVIIASTDEGGRIYYTTYAHLRDVDESIKQICDGASQCFDPHSSVLINPQSPVGASDNTGNSTGPHLHYELRYADGGKPSFVLPEGCGGYSAGMCQ